MNGFIQIIKNCSHTAGAALLTVASCCTQPAQQPRMWAANSPSIACSDTTLCLTFIASPYALLQSLSCSFPCHSWCCHHVPPSRLISCSSIAAAVLICLLVWLELTTCCCICCQHLPRAACRKTCDKPVDEDLRATIRAFCTGLVAALNKYYAFGSVFAEEV